MSQKDFEQANIDFTREIGEIEKQLRQTASAQADTDSFVRFAELQLLDIGGVWKMALAEQRRRVRQLLFDGGLRYSEKSGMSNTHNQNLYGVLETIAGGSITLATPEGVEPPTLSSED